MDTLIVNMRRTEGGDIAAFIEAWLEFVVYFNQVLPAFPLYNNMWFDLYNPRLSGVDVIQNLTKWSHPVSIVNLTLS
jgi:hypothetical protein